MFRPEYLEDFVGNDRATNLLRQLISNYKKTGKPIKHILFTGPAGCGKTTLTECFTNELLPAKYIYVNSNAINDLISLRDELSEFEENCYNVILFDECHALPNKVFDGLLSFLEYPYEICTVQNGVIKKEFPKTDMFTCVFATTNPEQIPDAVLTRLQEIRLESYTEESYDKMIDGIDPTGVIDEESRNFISSIVRGARQLYQLTEFFLNSATEILNINETKKLLDLAGYNEDGLKYCELKILQYIADNGVTSLETISAFTDINKKELVTDIEPFLVKKGLISIGSKGRDLTSAGKEYVEINNSNIITERIR